jgi:hypothetical protein
MPPQPVNGDSFTFSYVDNHSTSQETPVPPGLLKKESYPVLLPFHLVTLSVEPLCCSETSVSSVDYTAIHFSEQ